MILTITLVLASLVSLAVLRYAARGQSAPFRKFDDMMQELRPVDLDAFRNLIDPDEEEFLQSNLSPADFRALQRERLRAAVDYIAVTRRNAAILLRMGEAGARSERSEIVLASRRLMYSAYRLRLYAPLVMAMLLLRVALPNTRFSPGRLLDHYQSLSGAASQVARAQYPMYAARLSAVL